MRTVTQLFRSARVVQTVSGRNNMIHELSGDLLFSKADVIAHGVAPNDDFKNGLALALRQQFPAMYKDFRHYCKQEHPKPGDLWLWQGLGEDNRHVRIACLFTQDAPSHDGGHPGRAHTEHVNHALHKLKKLIEKDGYQSVALPRLATGVGGLAWPNVEPLIKSQLGQLGAQIGIYTDFKPGVAASEPFGEHSAN
ncbi:MAG: O-acetyl-ADP-ribose deacetylase (regulator of RNase III) [Planctomycetota bacterium]|jgi:O-acetyl-ADP-ribose deacetylase (regulator of RNase III)